MTDRATVEASLSDTPAAAAELANLATRGMPAGVLELAVSLLRGLPLRSKPGTACSTNETLAALLLAPHRLDQDWPEAKPPVAVADSWIHVEVVDADLPIFEALLDQHGTEDAEAFSSRCQTMRLPVCPYRRPDPERTAQNTPKTSVGPDIADRFDEPADLGGKLVVDMTAHWAGPLGAKLLAEAGATVVKIDPDCRPDGFRDRPAVYDHLNGEKDVISYDLRLGPDRDRFEKLLEKADLLIESFSRRVMGNLGYGWPQLKRLSPRLSLLSVRAFPGAGQNADWLGYGPGVHAAAGLAAWSFGLAPNHPEGHQIGSVPMPAPIAYPDFLTGIAAYARSTSQLAADQPESGTKKEVAMFEVISPLQAAEPGDRL